MDIYIYTLINTYIYIHIMIYTIVYYIYGLLIYIITHSVDFCLSILYWFCRIFTQESSGLKWMMLIWQKETVLLLAKHGVEPAKQEMILVENSYPMVIFTAMENGHEKWSVNHLQMGQWPWLSDVAMKWWNFVTRHWAPQSWHWSDIEPPKMIRHWAPQSWHWWGAQMFPPFSGGRESIIKSFRNVWSKLVSCWKLFSTNNRL